MLWDYLKQIIDKNVEWDDCIELAIYSYNTSVHEATQYTPYELIFAKVALTPASDPPIANGSSDTYAEYLLSLYKRMRKIQDIAKEHLVKAKIRSKELYDRRVRPQTFAVGDSVYLLKEPRKNKLDDQYTGPYILDEILDNNNVKIVMSRKTRVVHIDKIKKAK